VRAVLLRRCRKLCTSRGLSSTIGPTTIAANSPAGAASAAAERQTVRCASAMPRLSLRPQHEGTVDESDRISAIGNPSHVRSFPTLPQSDAVTSWSAAFSLVDRILAPSRA